MTPKQPPSILPSRPATLPVRRRASRGLAVAAAVSITAHMALAAGLILGDAAVPPAGTKLDIEIVASPGAAAAPEASPGAAPRAELARPPGPPPNTAPPPAKAALPPAAEPPPASPPMPQATDPKPLPAAPTPVPTDPAAPAALPPRPTEVRSAAATPAEARPEPLRETAPSKSAPRAIETKRHRARPPGPAADAEPRPASHDGPADPAAGAPATPPRAILGSAANPLPVYPDAARRNGWEGRVILTAIVAADGTATAVTVRASSGHRALDEAALAAVRRWTFTPARRGGIAIPGSVDVPIRFRLED